MRLSAEWIRSIVMPHTPTKKYAFMLAHSYYPELMEAGVKIYEYLPGFIHSKTFVSDDEKAVVAPSTWISGASI